MSDSPILSLCLIARDSHKTLPACLASIRPWVDELVVVDTGSSDDTEEIARSFGARLHRFAWCDDFSAARNESLRHARGLWLFWMDSDDTIDPENGRRLKELAHGHHPPSNLGYVMQVRCPGPLCSGDSEWTVVDQVKLIRNRPELRFDGRIHEQILPSIRQLGGDICWTDICVVHSGSDQTAEGRKRKQSRDLRILLLELSERPEHPFTLFNLGMTYDDMEDHRAAIDFLTRSLSVSEPGASHVRKAYALLVGSHVHCEEYDAAITRCTEGLKLFPDDPELLFRSATLAHRSCRLDDAEKAYLRLLAANRERHFSSIDTGIVGFKAHQNLAVVYQDMGRLDLAELHWREVVGERPKSRAGRQGLVDALLKLGRIHTADMEIDRVLEASSLRSTGLILRARVAESKGDFASARQDLLEAIKSDPNDAAPLEKYCRYLFDHGDPYEAKLALNELASRQPDDASVLHNLGAINMRLGCIQEAIDAYESSLRVRPDSPNTSSELTAAIHAHQSGRCVNGSGP